MAFLETAVGVRVPPPFNDLTKPASELKGLGGLANHPLPLVAPGRADEIRISTVIDSPEAVSLRSLRKLRNRCMHYLIPPTLTGLGEHLPMYGLVESTCPGHSFAIVNAELRLVLAAVSDALCSWKQE
jgi:hypothetical protein